MFKLNPYLKIAVWMLLIYVQTSFAASCPEYTVERKVLSFLELDCPSLAALSCVSKRWHQIVASELKERWRYVAYANILKKAEENSKKR